MYIGFIQLSFPFKCISHLHLPDDSYRRIVGIMQALSWDTFLFIGQSCLLDEIILCCFSWSFFFKVQFTYMFINFKSYSIYMYMSVCLFLPEALLKIKFFSGQIYIGLKRALLLCKTFLTSGYCQSVLIDLLSSIRFGVIC